MTKNFLALVVEDEETFAQLVVDSLEPLGFLADIESDGHEAFRMATTNNYDLITIDIGLPGWDGNQMMNSLDLLQERTPIIIITGSDVEETRKSVSNPNVMDVLGKPLNIERFNELVERAKAEASANSS